MTEFESDSAVNTITFHVTTILKYRKRDATVVD